ncbi:hypothetical protein D8829_06135 [Streptococcus intermedius]|nr:hypothetical protein D8829_06135 [Streptococcus intermedius]
MKCYSEQIADLAFKKSGLEACRTLPDQAFHKTIEQDVINKPTHYQGRYGMESIEILRNFMTDEQLAGFYLGNSLKYLIHHQKKNGLEDLKKARKNLDWLIEEMEEIEQMEDKELENIAFALQLGQLVLYTAKSIIKDDNLLRSEGHFMLDDRKFKIIVEEVVNDTKI